MCTGWNGAHPYPYSAIPPDANALAVRIAIAEQTLRQLTDRMGEIERQLTEVKARKPLHIEYHFDQLKVNELKGTLNVGLSPQGVQGIDSFETPQVNGLQQADSGPETSADQPPLADLMRSMDNYMALEAPVYLARLAQQFGAELDGDHRIRLLSDVKNQLKDRVKYYANTSAYPADGSDEERQLWHRFVLERTTKDVRDALMTYMSKWKTGMDNQLDGGNAT